jgi:hypothetical protein
MSYPETREQVSPIPAILHPGSCILHLVYRFALRMPSWSSAMIHLQMFAEPSTMV